MKKIGGTIMVTLLKTRRTWKRATVKQSPSFFKENIDQKIEKTIFDGKTALAITYKKNINLKDITFLKRSIFSPVREEIS